MADGDDLLDLVIGPTLRQRPRSGHMEAISLTASYDFSLAEYEAGALDSRATRTVRHETTHVYQALATSYGYYFQLIKAFQVSRVLQLLAGLEELGEEIRPPLITQVARHDEPRWRQPRVELYAWYLAEVVLIHLEGEFDHWSRILTENRVFRGRSFAELYVELEDFLVQWLAPQGHRVAVAPGQPRETDSMFDVMLHTLSHHGDTTSILESSAHVSEHWRIWPSRMRKLDRQLPTSQAYSSWVRWALSTGFTDDPRTFCLTFAAVADLALNGALLPHQSGFRQPGYDPMSVVPAHRMFWAIGTLARKDLAPLRGLDGYVPFVEELCDRFDWPLPWEMAHFVIPSLPPTDRLDPLGQIFQYSQELRFRVPYAFIDLDIWSVDGPVAREFRAAFVHPVIQFSDRVLYHQDKDVPTAAVLGFALGEYLRQLMIVGNRPVVLPIRTDERNLEFYRSLVEEHLAATIGLLDPRVTLVSAPPSINHHL